MAADMMAHRRSFSTAAPRRVPSGLAPLHRAAAGRSQALWQQRRRLQTAIANWKVWGPNSEYSDGDREYFELTNRLSQQYEWFAPKPTEQPSSEEQALLQQQEEPSTADGWGLSPNQIEALGLTGTRLSTPDSATLSSKHYMRGDKFSPEQSLFRAAAARGRDAYRMPIGGSYTSGARGTASSGAQASYYPEGRPIFMPEAERYGNPPDLPSLLLQQRVIYISMPFVSSVTELVVAQCYYLDFDDRNRQRPIYVYLNSTGCINDKGQAIAADNEFYAIWSALGFTRAPLYTGVTWKAQNQAAVLLAAGLKGHRYSFPHSKISFSPPVLNRVFGPSVDAQLQANQLEYATKYYAAILARSTGKDIPTCEKEYLSRRRYFSVKDAFEEGLIDKLVPGYKLNRFRAMRKEMGVDDDAFYVKDKPTFKFSRAPDAAAQG